MIKVGVVGLGSTIGIAAMHINALKLFPERAEIVALFDIIEGRAADYKDKFELSHAKECTSYEELLSIVDAVVICTPNAYHVDMVSKAIEQGKHVLCEKPFGRNAVECEKAMNASNITDKVCMLGFCYRGVPGFRLMHKMIQEGTIGQVYYVNQSQGGDRIANEKVKREWRMNESLSGSGATCDFGSHLLDMVDWMIREQAGKIVEVQSMHNTFITGRNDEFSDEILPVTNDDVAMFSARTETGVLINSVASRIGATTAMEIFGSKGSLHFSNDDPFSIKVRYKKENGPYDMEVHKIDVDEKLYMVNDRIPKAPFLVNFAIQTSDFLDAIEYDRPYENTFDRGHYIQKLLDEIYESGKTGEKRTINF